MLVISFKETKQSGMGLVEVILAVALFGLFATALIGLLMTSYGSDVQASQRDVALLRAQEGMEAVWSIRSRAWNLLENGTYGLSNANGYWEFLGNSEVLDDNYTRTVIVSDGCRDNGGEIVDCLAPGAIVDLHTKKVNIQVDYTSINGIGNLVELTAYATTWQTQDWVQANWVSGAGQSVWADDTRYDSDNGNIDVATGGQVKLASFTGGGCGTKIWSLTSVNDYTYPANEIEIAGGYAQLVSAPGGLTGVTINPGFDTNVSGWSYADWNQGGGEVNVTGNRQSANGNPGGWVYLSIPSGSGDEVGGYGYQSFVTSVNNPSATLSFDWQVSQYAATPNTFQLYVFIDSFPGAPTIGQEVWSSGEMTGVQGWNPVANIDVSSKLVTAGTYYLKVAVWIETPGGGSIGPFEVGYDNVQLDWQQSGNYPINQPTINPNTSHSVNDIDRWTSFVETANKNGGEIYYQLSDDDGTTWQFWDGNSWEVATASDYNTASVVNTNIQSFSTTSAQIIFKAFLDSDGSELVQLDEVGISCSQYFDWNFADAVDYNYDLNNIEITAGKARLKQFGSTINGFVAPFVDSLEFDTDQAIFVDLINIFGEVYAAAYQGPGSDGWLKTFTIDSAGNISNAVIDSLEFDISDGFEPDIVHVDGEVYAIAYRGAGSDGFVTTVTIDSAGNISNAVIDSLEFDTSNGREPSIIQISSTVYAVAYRGPGEDGWLKTFTIDSAGNISNAVIDSLEFDTVNTLRPDLINVIGDIYGIAYQGPGDDGWLATVNIDSAGNISSAVIDSLEFDINSGFEPDIIHTTGSNYVITYRGPDNDGWVQTLSIDNAGNISNSAIDSLEFDVSDGYEPSIVNFSGDYYAVAYRGVGNDGFITMFTIDSGGNISNSITNTYEYDVVNGNLPHLMLVNNNFLVVGYTGPSTDGWVKTIQIDESGGYSNADPSIVPVNTLDVVDLSNWASFTETANKNGGEIYYHLSDDGGSTWRIWDGNSWTTSGVIAGFGNTAAEVNANIPNFATTTGQILFKAFLSSDGTQLVELDNVQIGWGQATGAGDSGYATDGWFVSSAFNMGNNAAVNIVEWQETLPSCSPSCDIRLQVRTAPDAAGSPGAWTAWYGDNGPGTYFTDSGGAIINSDLNFNRWVQYRVELIGDGSDTPVLEEVKINYLP